MKAEALLALETAKRSFTTAKKNLQKHMNALNEMTAIDDAPAAEGTAGARARAPPNAKEIEAANRLYELAAENVERCRLLVSSCMEDLAAFDGPALSAASAAPVTRLVTATEKFSAPENGTAHRVDSGSAVPKSSVAPEPLTTIATGIDTLVSAAQARVAALPSHVQAMATKTLPTGLAKSFTGEAVQQYITVTFPALVLLRPVELWPFLLMQAAATASLQERLLREVVLPGLDWPATQAWVFSNYAGIMDICSAFEAFLAVAPENFPTYAAFSDEFQAAARRAGLDLNEATVSMLFLKRLPEQHRAATMGQLANTWTWKLSDWVAAAARTAGIYTWPKRVTPTITQPTAAPTQPKVAPSNAHQERLCYNCNKSGHIAKFCPDSKKEEEEEANVNAVRHMEADGSNSQQWCSSCKRAGMPALGHFWKSPICPLRKQKQQAPTENELEVNVALHEDAPVDENEQEALDVVSQNETLDAFTGLFIAE
jgi:hypothetical protein